MFAKRRTLPMSQRGITALLAIGFALGATRASAGELTLKGAKAQPGNQLSVPVVYREDRGLVAAGVATDITFDATVLRNPRCAPGKALAGSAKTVVCAEVSPGQLRLGIVGLDHGSVPQGEVARVTFDVASNARPGHYQLQHTPSAADADGKDYSLQKQDAQIDVSRPAK
jgi:cohesin domain-containing protein